VRKHLLAESLPDLADCLTEKLGFAGEVVLQSTRSHAGTLCDSPGRGVCVSLRDQTVNRGIEQRRASSRSALGLGATATLRCSENGHTLHNTYQTYGMHVGRTLRVAR
jgi:hypothetical protein